MRNLFTYDEFPHISSLCNRKSNLSILQHIKLYTYLWSQETAFTEEADDTELTEKVKTKGKRMKKKNVAKGLLQSSKIIILDAQFN